MKVTDGVSIIEAFALVLDMALDFRASVPELLDRIGPGIDWAPQPSLPSPRDDGCLLPFVATAEGSDPLRAPRLVGLRLSLRARAALRQGGTNRDLMAFSDWLAPAEAERLAPGKPGAIQQVNLTLPLRPGERMAAGVRRRIAPGFAKVEAVAGTRILLLTEGPKRPDGRILSMSVSLDARRMITLSALALEGTGSNPP